MDNYFLEELSNWFTAYCRSFAGDDAEARRNYDLKEEHTRRVRANIRLLAESVGLTDGRLALAEAIGLLHDLGRFEQYRRYRTFLDRESVNHAAFGVEIIREQRLLDGLPEDESETVILAVRLHNAFTLPTSLAADQRLYLDLIRDADKLDIWRVFTDLFAQPESERASAATLGFPDEPYCSPEVLSCLETGEMVNLSLVRTVNDFKLLQISWVFDLNTPFASKLAREQGNLARLAAILPPSSSLDSALHSAWKHLEAHAG